MFCLKMEITPLPIFASLDNEILPKRSTVKIVKFGTPQTVAIIVLKKEKFDVTLH